MELPPRARRIHPQVGPQHGKTGTTSACAENTMPLRTYSTGMRNYLRVRGEYLPAGNHRSWQRELPPRARRIQFGHSARTSFAGTTSACAENTGQHPKRANPPGNYLRVRGEYEIERDLEVGFYELPPRARRIL